MKFFIFAFETENSMENSMCDHVAAVKTFLLDKSSQARFRS